MITLKVHPRTWYSEHMSGFRYTGSGRATTSQAEMKDEILQELKGATFIDDLTAQGAPLHADQNDVQKVLDHLRDNRRVTHVTLFGNDASTEDAPRLPSIGFGVETKSYGPLTHLLDIIVRAANSCLTGPRYLEALRFYPHDAEMGDKVNLGRPLKPDILGLLHSHTPKILWRDVSVFIEVKGHVVEAIKQLATYARSHLTLDRRRSFSIAMHFDHKELMLRFLCFHRSGLCGSLPLSLKTENGFRSVVEHMVGILSIQDEEAFGLDMTRVGNMYCLNGGNYDIVRTIQMRENIRGHSTVVYALKRQSAGTKDYPASLRSRELTCVDGVPQFPEEVIYKLSYQIEGHPSEGILFSSFFGQFGVVDVIGFHVCTSEDIFGSTLHHFSNPRFFKLDDQSPVRTPEHRYLHCTAMTLEGLPLLDTHTEAGIPTPAELMETILHSMIGHYNLFLGGVLHRDISSGNILRLREPINRSPGHSMPFLVTMVDEGVDLSLCRGFLIDGDHAIEWRKGAITSSLERSGTLPFMSRRLLRALQSEKQALHTAIDDLESFLWVLIWALVNIFKKVANITNENSIIHQLRGVFSSRVVTTILSREGIVKDEWTDAVFGDLIREWLRFAEDSRAFVMKQQKTLLAPENDMAQERILDELDERCKEDYEKFIRAGYNHLQTIRNSVWENVVAFNGESLNE